MQTEGKDASHRKDISNIWDARNNKAPTTLRTSGTAILATPVTPGTPAKAGKLAKGNTHARAGTLREQRHPRQQGHLQKQGPAMIG
jgi:hypothetical protein